MYSSSGLLNETVTDDNMSDYVFFLTHSTFETEQTLNRLHLTSVNTNGSFNLLIWRPLCYQSCNGTIYNCTACLSTLAFLSRTKCPNGKRYSFVARRYLECPIDAPYALLSNMTYYLAYKTTVAPTAAASNNGTLQYTLPTDWIVYRGDVPAVHRRFSSDLFPGAFPCACRGEPFIARSQIVNSALLTSGPNTSIVFSSNVTTYSSRQHSIRFFYVAPIRMNLSHRYPLSESCDMNSCNKSSNYSLSLSLQDGNQSSSVASNVLVQYPVIHLNIISVPVGVTLTSIQSPCHRNLL